MPKTSARVDRAHIAIRRRFQAVYDVVAENSSAPDVSLVAVHPRVKDDWTRVKAEHEKVQRQMGSMYEAGSKKPSEPRYLYLLNCRRCDDIRRVPLTGSVTCECGEGTAWLRSEDGTPVTSGGDVRLLAVDWENYDGFTSGSVLFAEGK